MNKIKQHLLSGVFISTFCFASGANAEGVYAGFSLGNASLDESEIDSAVGWKLFGGYEVSDNIAIEGGYTSFGEMDISDFWYSATLEITGFELAAVGSYPINDQLSLLGKLGFLRWDAEFDFSGLGSVSTSGTDIFFGLGGQYNLSDNLDVRATWERYTVEDTDADLLSASVVYSF